MGISLVLRHFLVIMADMRELVIHHLATLDLVVEQANEEVGEEEEAPSLVEEVVIVEAFERDRQVHNG